MGRSGERADQAEEKVPQSPQGRSVHSMLRNRETASVARAE